MINNSTQLQPYLQSKYSPNNFAVYPQVYMVILDNNQKKVLRQYDVNESKERVYLLHIFELAFSSDVHRKSIFIKMTDWEEKRKSLPEDINRFDWRNFQQERG